MNKKTDFPDLERLPDTNFWKHFLWFCWNQPRIFVEDIYEKYVLKPKMNKEIAEYNHSIRVTELLSKIQFLEAELNELKKRKN